MICLAAGPATLARSQELEEAPRFEAPPLPVAQPDSSGGAVESSILAPTAEAESTAEVLPEPAEIAETPRDELLSIVRRRHPWARLDPGAWRRVQILSEAFDADGEFAGRSLTTRIERLTAVDDASYTIDVETTVELAGRSSAAPSETQRLGILTDLPVADLPPQVSEEDPASVSMGDVVSPCRVWRIERPDEVGVTTDRVYVAEEGPPILRRERSVGSGEQDAARFTDSVVSGGLPVEYGGALVETWAVHRSRAQAGGGRSEQSSVHASEPPGGLVNLTVAEYNAQGSRSRWAVTRLVESGRTPEERIVTNASSRPAVDRPIEVRPRRLLKLLRRGELTEPEL